MAQAARDGCVPRPGQRNGWPLEPPTVEVGLSGHVLHVTVAAPLLHVVDAQLFCESRAALVRGPELKVFYHRGGQQRPVEGTARLGTRGKRCTSPS